MLEARKRLLSTVHIVSTQQEVDMRTEAPPNTHSRAGSISFGRFKGEGRYLLAEHRVMYCHEERAVFGCGVVDLVVTMEMEREGRWKNRGKRAIWETKGKSDGIVARWCEGGV
jgi:hypothetical protein